MRYGYFMMPMHPPGSDPAETLEIDLAQVRRLDELGFEEAWIGEHFTGEWENIPAPDLFIAAALQRTERIKLGTGVTCLPNHNPFHLAHRIAQLDQMARGRFLWGVGSGGFPGDFAVAGIDPKSGLQRQVTIDAVDTVLSLWDSPKPGTYEGHTWTFTVPEVNPRIAQHVYMKPFQQPHPPIAVAGVSAKSDTLVLAGERGYIPMSINFVPPRVLKTHWEAYEQGAGRAGRTTDRARWRIARDVYVADTNARARQEALAGPLARDYRDYFLRLLGKMRGLEILKVDPAMPDAEVTLEYLLDNIWIVGDPDTVAARLAALDDEVGGFGTLLVIAHEWRPRTAWERSMVLLREQVLPRVAA
jgi:alkanesulfonate monooxygenase SsuD/methylene tetrahydromethanopterin reductase-like flavin-dependent oxidoreductase (luciferase family)